jgi:hypothetical protein
LENTTFRKLHSLLKEKSFLTPQGMMKKILMNSSQIIAQWQLFDAPDVRIHPCSAPSVRGHEYALGAMPIQIVTVRWRLHAPGRDMDRLRQELRHTYYAVLRPATVLNL